MAGATDEVRGPSAQKALGYRWFAVMALGLAQLLLAPLVPIPWLPADKVLVPLDSVWPWVLCVLLVGFAVLSSVPLDRMGLSWARFLSAAVQGFIVGHLVIFDPSTLLARLTHAALLGAANALDRIETTVALRNAMEAATAQARVGSLGTLDRNGKALAIRITDMRDTQVTVHLEARPYWFSSNNYVTLDHNDPRLQLTALPSHASGMIAKSFSMPGFQLRPWGYSLGVSVAQWLIAGFGRADSFVAGMLTQDALIIFSIPVTSAILWYVANSYDSEQVRCLCLVAFVGLCCLEIGAFLPMLLGLAGFAIVQLIAHQVVAYVAILCDELLFFKLNALTPENLAEAGLLRILMRGRALLGGPAAVSTEPLRRVLIR